MADHDLADAITLVRHLQPAMQQRDRAEIVSIVRRLVAISAPLGEQWHRIAQLVHRYGEPRLARAAIDLFVDAQAGAPQAQYLKASLLEQAGALREAYSLMCALPESVPDPAAHAYSRGTAALFLGDMAEARVQLERAVSLRPQMGPAWLSLAMSVDFAAEPAMAEKLIAAAPQVDLSMPAQAAAYHYGQGKALAELGEHDRAFAAFAQGARAMKSVQPYDREADRRHAQDSMTGYTAGSIAGIASRQTEPTGRAIFVMGTARSGTTLVEQILTCHSAVGEGGEINRLYLLGNEVGGPSFPALERYANAQGVAPAARLWSHWLAERCPTPGRVVDKTLSATRSIGQIASLLPDAPLIWMTRDPLDRAWSSFRTYFPVGMNWSYDLEDIAHFFRQEDELLAFWQDVLADRLLVVPYEALVGDPETWIRRILLHCGLPEQPQVFTPHTARRQVTTASVAQVRKPINRAGLGAAEPYRAYLQPFLESYRS